jgi:hypothetical protein
VTISQTTTLDQDVLDADFGGRAANKFGLPAWQWLNSVVRFLSRAYLTYSRVSYTTVVVVSQTSLVPGDVVVVVMGNVVAAQGYDARKYVGSLTVPIWLGVALEPCSALAKVRVATGGVIPSIVSGFAEQSAPAYVGLNVSTGRLRVAQTGDVVMGGVDMQGNVLLSGSGMTLP